jgi:hypothetical protein
VARATHSSCSKTWHSEQGVTVSALRLCPCCICTSAAALLGVDKDGLLKALTTRTRQTPEGPIVSPLDVKAATENRDSLAKIIYSKARRWASAATPHIPARRHRQSASTAGTGWVTEAQLFRVL